ncbi:uncharacterized protein LOC134444615 isoform X2 [Engraulis encrasicolus]|uniref:uncharacterized protein LOC134444615 isoform X2 n=1 Tax=Engraulis encrasicolus TaxID=184585 RepID=UPI002FD015D6
MRSDRSKDDPPRMAAEEERDTGVSRAPSMRSDRSKDEPPRMAEERRDTGVSRAPSMRSDWSKDAPPRMAAERREQEMRCEQDTSNQDKQGGLHHIFEVLEEKIITFVKKELQRYKQILSPGYRETFEKISEDESDAREGVLQMTLHFLRKMELQDLADELHESKNSFFFPHRGTVKGVLQYNMYSTV